MRKFSTESKAAGGDSEKFTLPKRRAGKVQLPPLPTTVTVGSYGLLDNAENERFEDGSQHCDETADTSPNDNLVTPKIMKYPMSPSSLSIQFNFDETTQAPPKVLASSQVKDTSRGRTSHEGHKHLTSPKRNLISNSKDPDWKGNHVKKSCKKTALSPDGKTVKVGRYRTLSHASTANSITSSKGRKALVAEQRSSEPTLDVTINDQRKASIYNLREFLSLSPDTTQGKIPKSFLTQNDTQVSPQVKKKQPVKTAKKKPAIRSGATNGPPPQNYMYNLFESLALAEHSPSAEDKQKKGSGVKGKKLPGRVQSTKSSSQNVGIPSVVVAEWNTNDESSVDMEPRQRRRQHEIPKVDFPNAHFLAGHSEVRLGATETGRQSVYNLKEFLNLKDFSSKTSRKAGSQNDGGTSSDGKSESRRGSQAQYNLQEFLAFMESRGSINLGTDSSLSAQRSIGTSIEGGMRHNRTISVYDIYEFLKATSSVNLQAGELQMHAGTNDKSSVVNGNGVAAESSSNNLAVEERHESTDKDSKPSFSSSNSTYNLREFLGLSVGAESSQADSEGKAKSAFA